MKKLRILPGMLAFAAVLMAGGLAGCQQDNTKPEPNNENKLTPDATWQIMNLYYLWNNTLPEIDPASYDTPQAVLEALRNQDYDRYSYIETTEDFNNYFKQGEYIGHGFSLGYDSDGNLRVAFVYDRAPAGEAGVRRGWIIKSINGTAIQPFSDYTGLLGDNEIGVENDFLFLDSDSNEVDLTIDKNTVDIQTILYKDVINVDGRPTGYMVFNNFITPAITELKDAFDYFSGAGVRDFILDLRYNGGGAENVYSYLAGLLGGSKTDGQVITKYIHNSQQSSRDTSIRALSYDNSLDIDRIEFIQSRSTASASELIINGMKPYLDVTSFGDNTYGKPVGMYVWQFDDFTFAPICFKFVNADDEGDFYDGLIPEEYVKDDLTVPFGDPEEDCLKAVIEYLKTGVLPESDGTKKSGTVMRPGSGAYGLKFMIGAV